MTGTPRQAADLLRYSNVSVLLAARLLAREPKSPVTQTLKLWGDDKDPFRRLIIGKSAEARVWRETVGLLLRHLRPDTSRKTVWRGWNFSSAGARDRIWRNLERTKRFSNIRIGMSASRSRRIACRSDFLNRFGVLWEIRAPLTARDLAPVFRAIGAKFPAQREVIFPNGAKFTLVTKPAWITIRQDGQAMKVRHYVLREKP